MKKCMQTLAINYNLELIKTPLDQISLVLSLEGIMKYIPGKKASYIGGLLYTARVSGIRIVNKDDKPKIIGDLKFKDFGCSHDNYHKLPYLTCKAGMGVKINDIDVFIKRFRHILDNIIKKSVKKPK